MTHDESTLRTKLELARALKALMAHKALAKITVSELVEAANVNRKTFYYHFADVYALLQWLLEQEALEVVRQFDLLIDYEDAIRFVIRYVHDNEHILNCAYDSVGRDELKRFIYNNFVSIVRHVIDDCEARHSLQVDASFKQFLSSFVSEAIAGMLVSGFKNKVTPEQDELVRNFTIILDALPGILQQAAAAGASEKR